MDSPNRINFFQTNRIQPMQLEGMVSVDAQNTGNVSFKDMVANMMSEINEVTNKPQELAGDMLQGKADIHDVMAAIAQSELTVQAATTVTGKILQTYEKIMQIQI
ncbi:MAG: flagellar hook-basal body complex protein FliE [Candidatus Gastranaerophilales bacterium]|nr:flagellar hook-basal body complex protein FliE [Candidatus Gastranaerophilales bacterium]